MLVHTRLPHWKAPSGYDWQFSQDRFGLFVAAPPDRVGVTRQILESTNPERTYVVQ
jgi:hypothetical protein